MSSVKLLEGKTIAVIGDSYVSNYYEDVDKTWHSRVAKRLGMKYLNFGIDGACISVDRSHELCGPRIIDRYLEIPKDVDCILVIAGHNDAFYIGESESYWKPFLEALEVLCSGLKEHYPNARIGYVTPWNIHRDCFQKVISSIHELCDKYSIPVLDTKTSVINPESYEFRKKYFQFADYGHLNAAGHELLLDWGEAFIKQIMGV